jgi:type IV secretory pathway TraG/TraD family ATPase VirD4
VLGPPRSGKTSSLVIPNILLSEGPVLSTSTKPDVMQATAPSRCGEGWSFLYDPSGEVECPPGVERVGW